MNQAQTPDPRQTARAFWENQLKLAMDMINIIDQSVQQEKAAGQLIKMLGEQEQQLEFYRQDAVQRWRAAHPEVPQVDEKPKEIIKPMTDPQGNAVIFLEGHPVWFKKP